MKCLHLQSGFPLLQRPHTQPHSRVPWSGGRLWACSKGKTHFNCIFSPLCFLRISLQQMALAKWLSNKAKWCKHPSVPPPPAGKHLSLASQALRPCSQPLSGACRRGSQFYRALRDKSCFLLLQPLMKICLLRIQMWSGSRFAPVSAGRNQTITVLREQVGQQTARAKWAGKSPLGTPLLDGCSSGSLIRSSEQGFFVLYMHIIYLSAQEKQPTANMTFASLIVRAGKKKVPMRACSTEWTIATALP